MARAHRDQRSLHLRRAMHRLLKEYGFDQTPDLAANALELLTKLHDSGITDEDELVELAAMSGGRPVAETPRSNGGF